MGNEPEEQMRTCLLATALAESVGVPEEEIPDVYFAALLEHVGCTAGAHEAAASVGDDIALYRAGARTNFARPSEVFSSFIPELMRGRSLGERTRVAAASVRLGRLGTIVFTANCEVAASTARRLGLGAGLQRALHEMFEWWNGKGLPQGLAGDEIALPARIVRVAGFGVLFHRLGGAELAARAVRERAGTMLDPDVAERFAAAAPELLADAVAGDALERVLEAEPRPRKLVSGAELDTAARAFADVVDLKSPFLHGHSTRVALLAEGAARNLGLQEAEAVLLRRAGLFHDVGRAGVSTGIWEKEGRLTAAEWEQVRLHAYHSERVLLRSDALAPLASIAGAHHERQDGSGYHRGLRAQALPLASRILAAADVYVALTQRRPYRAALEPDAAAAELRAEARRSRLDPEVVECVLGAAGLAEHRRRAWPAALTDREVEVLRLVAAGLSNREIAGRLVISRRTAEHHVQHVYAKIGVSSRAAAALFALEHGLLAELSET